MGSSDAIRRARSKGVGRMLIRGPGRCLECRRFMHSGAGTNLLAEAQRQTPSKDLFQYFKCSYSNILRIGKQTKTLSAHY